jgi:hypothetical protein
MCACQVRVPGARARWVADACGADALEQASLVQICPCRNELSPFVERRVLGGRGDGEQVVRPAVHRCRQREPRHVPARERLPEHEDAIASIRRLCVSTSGARQWTPRGGERWRARTLTARMISRYLLIVALFCASSFFAASPAMVDPPRFLFHRVPRVFRSLFCETPAQAPPALVGWISPSCGCDDSPAACHGVEESRAVGGARSGLVGSWGHMRGVWPIAPRPTLRGRARSACTAFRCTAARHHHNVSPLAAPEARRSGGRARS